MEWNVISGWVLKECRNELLEPLYDIITCSMNTVKLALEWMEANSVPIYNSGAKTKPINCR